VLPTPNEPLPPELNPRGRRAAERQQAALARQQAQLRGAHAAPPTARPVSSGAPHTGVLDGLALGGKILAVLLSVTILVASGWIWATWTGFKSDLKHVDAITKPTPGVTGASGVPTRDIDGKAQNILITGNDNRQTATDAELKQLGTTRDGGSLNTDTMMVMHVPADGSKATVFSFPRDSYVAIPGHGMNKLNSAYPFGYNGTAGSVDAKMSGGAQLLVQTIEGLTGLTIDHYVQVDLLGFYRISNAIGGVSVNLCAAQNEPNSGINLPKGISTIEGQQALAFVRQRYGLPGGDLDRIKRQQYFLSAAFRKMTSSGVLLNPFKLQSLLKAVSDSIYTDPGLDPLALANQLSALTAGNLTFSTIPTDGFANNSAGSVVVVHPDDVRAFVSTVVGLTNSTSSTPSAPKSSTAATTVARGSFTVDVLNGAGTSGTAARNATALAALGFQVGTVGNAASTPATVIQYPDGQQAQAGNGRRGDPGRHRAGLDVGQPGNPGPGYGRPQRHRRGQRQHGQLLERRDAEAQRHPDRGHQRRRQRQVHQLNDSPESLFAAFVAAQPARPFVTFYDDASGERSELSAKSLANWVAKTFFLLTDELGLGVGDRAFVAVSAHWIALPVLLGSWTAGLGVTRDPGAAAVAFVGPDTVDLAAGVPDVFAVAPDAAARGFEGVAPFRCCGLRRRDPPATRRLGVGARTRWPGRRRAGRPVADRGGRPGPGPR